MITEAIFNVFFHLITLLINLLPSVYILRNLSSIGAMMEILSKGFIVFPAGLWVTSISCILFWKTAQLAWVVVEWIYKKIPGVN